MKKVFPLILFTVLCSLFTASAQQGQWTWMNGDSAINSSGHYGPLGVFSPLNSPPALYEACQWTDQQGFFWLFGGCTSNNDDLWKFDPAINQWAWIKGPGIGNRPGIYGTLQVPSMTNNPGGRGFGEMSWTDNDNNLWMYGGYGNGINNSQGWLSDLWKYDISTNEWTWMSGSNTVNTVPVYGIMGVPSPLNTPGGRAESNASWVDNNNNLWLFGGQLVNTVGQRGGDLWMYNTSINQWVWMSGTNANNALPVWGIKGIPSAANMPGGRWSYAAWKSCDGDFWMFGGWVYNDMWRYNIASNMWTWMSGGNSNVNHNVTQCVPDTGKYPSVRQENRACWNLGGNNFVNYGGNTSGDLWNFNATSLEWTLMKGNPDTSSVQNSGTILVSSPTNTPGNRMGALGFKDNQGNLWLFGGINGPGYCNDMWKFIPGTTCPHILMVNNVTSSFNALPLTGCSPLTVTFNNSSINGSSFLWNFGDNTTSTSFNPIHIYSSPGTYIISLIVNSTCSSQPDTSSQIITVYPSPSTLITGISTFCQGDSSILTASANSNYHWSTGSSNQTITVNSSNTYSVTVTNTNGCTGTASQTITVHPNPTPIITGNNSFCIGDSSVLDVGSFDQYLWSTGATSQTIIVNTSGTYFVTVTNNYGCTNTASQTVTVNPNQSPLITGNSSICQGDSSTLDAGSFLHYNWSTGSSNQTITVNSSNT
ncbi:MAG: kelch repeat-containing protein, partial [Bacteroidota bacterium]